MIGILAGMGPKSTGPFVDKVVEQCQKIYGAKYDMDFPPMLIYSCPTPFYIDRPVDHRALEAAIVAGAKRLAGTSVDFIAIPCNIAHVYFSAITAAVSIPVLNMADETLHRIPPQCRRVAVLATPPTLEAGIYQRGIVAAGCEYIQHPAWQSQVNALISGIKSSTDLTTVRNLWDKLTTELALEADAAIIACTDLNVIADIAENPLPLVDSSLSLAQAIVKTYLDSRR